MLEFIAYRQKLSALQKERQTVIASMPRPAENEEYEPSFSEHQRLEIVEHKIYRLISDYYWERAFQVGVPVPEGSEYWEKSEAFPGTEHLNRKGLSQLRATIHEERKRRLEVCSLWVAGATGLIGALTGLVAVFGSIG